MQVVIATSSLQEVETATSGLHALWWLPLLISLSLFSSSGKGDSGKVAYIWWMPDVESWQLRQK
jgi:hypothetical protein